MLKYGAAENLERVFHALSDPSRLAMVERLSAAPLSVSELARPFPMSLAAVMQHLAVLEASGVVQTEKTGRVRTCRLVTERLAQAEQWMKDRRALWEQRFDHLQQLVETDEET
jgi:DNA-binding transcriptional ArsR family regulator